MIKCEICGEKFKFMQWSHLRNEHGISIAEYKRLYPNTTPLPEKDELLNVIENGVYVDICGEGKMIGTPVVHVILSGCNLRCSWRKNDGDGDLCDRFNTSWKAEDNLRLVDNVVDQIRSKGVKIVYFSGGETMMQPEALTNLMKQLKKDGFYLMLETNATMFDEEVADQADFISVAPKLTNTIPWQPNLRNTDYEYDEKRALKHGRLHLRINIIQYLIDNCYIKENRSKRVKNFEVKFTVLDEVDVKEAKLIVDQLTFVNSDDIYLMPVGSTKEIVEESAELVIREAIKYGWNYSPRLQKK